MLADRESRVFNDRSEWMLHQDIFQKISLLWGPFEIDLFASRLNKQVYTCVSWKPDPGATTVDAFSLVWGRKLLYVFPPFPLIQRCLQKITADKAECVIIVPLWPTQTYCQVDVHVDSRPKTTAEEGEPLKIAPYPEKNPLWKKRQLMACLVSGIASRKKEFRKKQDESCCSRGEKLPGTSMASISKNGHNFLVKGTLIYVTYL